MHVIDMETLHWMMQSGRSIVSLLTVMQSTGYLDKSVVKNHQFTPKCSPDHVYPTMPPCPHPTPNLEHLIRFGHFKSSPHQNIVLDLRISHFKSPRPPTRLELLIKNFNIA